MEFSMPDTAGTCMSRLAMIRSIGGVKHARLHPTLWMHCLPIQLKLTGTGRADTCIEL